MRNLKESSNMTEASRYENLSLQAIQLDVDNEKSVIEGINRISEEKGGGTIGNIASVGGRITIPFHLGYHGTKFVLEGLSESAQYELEPFGLRSFLV